MDSHPPNLKKVFVTKELGKLIQASESLTTWGDVVQGLKTYIARKDLFNFKSMKVFCQNDELETLFGVPEFSILDIKNLLKKFVIPFEYGLKEGEIDKLPTCSVSSLKRKSEDVEKEAKKVKKFDCCNSETIEETEENVKFLETSILDFDKENSLLSEENTFVSITQYDVEFEPLSSTDREHGDEESDSDLSIVNMDLLISSFISIVASDSDIEYLADLSSDASLFSNSLSFDDELSKVDLWLCDNCSHRNNPRNRYCSKCFSVRNGWLSSEQKPKPKRKRKKSKAKNKKATPFLVKSVDLPCTSDKSEKNGTAQNPSENKLCLLCCERLSNSFLVHGKFAHNVSCYKCGMKLKKRKMVCPICRRKIEKVVIQI